MAKEFSIAIEKLGCENCGNNFEYSVVFDLNGPDELMYSRTYQDLDDAEDMAQALTWARSL